MAVVSSCRTASGACRASGAAGPGPVGRRARRPARAGRARSRPASRWCPLVRHGPSPTATVGKRPGAEPAVGAGQLVPGRRCGPARSATSEGTSCTLADAGAAGTGGPVSAASDQQHGGEPAGRARAWSLSPDVAPTVPAGQSATFGVAQRREQGPQHGGGGTDGGDPQRRPDAVRRADPPPASAPSALTPWVTVDIEVLTRPRIASRDLGDVERAGRDVEEHDRRYPPRPRWRRGSTAPATGGRARPGRRSCRTRRPPTP